LNKLQEQKIASQENQPRSKIPDKKTTKGLPDQQSNKVIHKNRKSTKANRKIIELLCRKKTMKSLLIDQPGDLDSLAGQKTRQNKHEDTGSTRQKDHGSKNRGSKGQAEGKIFRIDFIYYRTRCIFPGWNLSSSAYHSLFLKYIRD
jgi:hypothetical protein